MKPAIKLDEDLSPMVARPFEAAGYAIGTVLGQGWAGIKDAELSAGVNAERRILVTADKGFGDIRSYSPGSHLGIVLLRPDRESIVEFRALAERLVSQYDLAELVRATVVVSSRNVRIRRR